MSANRVGLDELELDEDAPSNATFSYRRFALMKWIKRRKVLVFSVTVVLILVITLIILTTALPSDTEDLPKATDDAKLNEIISEEWEHYLEAHPEDSTLFGYSIYNDRWSDISLTGLQNEYNHQKALLEKLATLQIDETETEAMINLQLLKTIAEYDVGYYDNKLYLLPVDQMNGVQVTIPQIVSMTPFVADDDYEKYIGRLNNLPLFLDQTIDLLKEGVKAGITVPNAVLHYVPPQFELLVSSDNNYENNAFFKPLSKLASSNTYRVRGLEAISTKVVPAWNKLLNYLETDYIPNSRPTIATRDLPNGENMYKFLIKFQTSIYEDPEQIHQTGLDEVTRILALQQKIVDDLVDETNAHNTSEFANFLRTNDTFYFKSEADLLMFVRDVCKRADGELPYYFGILPKCPYKVIPVPASEAPSAPAAYYFPPADKCTRPGEYYINTYDLSQRPYYLFVSTSMHEAVPGHHLQLAIQEELEIPDFRKYIEYWNSFYEGWALYSESLGEEMGFYTDPFILYGRYGDEILRACRLVVDTGIHWKGWTRQAAIDYMIENTPLSVLDITSEVDRYIVMPAQALGYKIGELKIKALRANAEASLGTSFDIREFHDSVLGKGALPLPILEENVNAWVASKKSV